MNSSSYLYQITTAYVVIMDALLALVLMWSMRANGATLRSMLLWGLASGLWIGGLSFESSCWHLIPEHPSSNIFFAIMLSGVALMTLLFFVLPPGTSLRKGGHAWLLFPQGMRAFFGAGFMIEGIYGIYGIMPPAFAVADGLTHITAAVLSLWTALLWTQGKIGRGGVLLTNLFGLIDIAVVAGGIAFNLLPQIGPHHNVMIAAFYAAPVFVALHVISLLDLRRSR